MERRRAGGHRRDYPTEPPADRSGSEISVLRRTPPASAATHSRWTRQLAVDVVWPHAAPHVATYDTVARAPAGRSVPGHHGVWTQIQGTSIYLYSSRKCWEVVLKTTAETNGRHHAQPPSALASAPGGGGGGGAADRPHACVHALPGPIPPISQHPSGTASSPDLLLTPAVILSPRHGCECKPGAPQAAPCTPPHPRRSPVHCLEQLDRSMLADTSGCHLGSCTWVRAAGADQSWRGRSVCASRSVRQVQCDFDSMLSTRTYASCGLNTRRATQGWPGDPRASGGGAVARRGQACVVVGPLSWASGWPEQAGQDPAYRGRATRSCTRRCSGARAGTGSCCSRRARQSGCRKACRTRWMVYVYASDGVAPERRRILRRFSHLRGTPTFFLRDWKPWDFVVSREDPQGGLHGAGGGRKGRGGGTLAAMAACDVCVHPPRM